MERLAFLARTIHPNPKWRGKSCGAKAMRFSLTFQVQSSVFKECWSAWQIGETVAAEVEPEALNRELVRPLLLVA
jgi:hypothetical protein